MKDYREDLNGLMPRVERKAFWQRLHREDVRRMTVREAHQLLAWHGLWLDRQALMPQMPFEAVMRAKNMMLFICRGKAGAA